MSSFEFKEYRLLELHKISVREREHIFMQIKRDIEITVNSLQRVRTIL